MSLPMPSQTALHAAGDLLRALLAALQARGLYPTDHPDRDGPRDGVVPHLQEVHEVAPGEPALLVTRGSVYLGPSLLAQASLSMHRLVRTFEEVGIESLQWPLSAGADDVEALLEVLAGDKDLGERVGAFAVNQIDPRETITESAIDLEEIRRAYAMSLDALRDFGVRLAAGDGIDIDSATSTVERLADEVYADPANALLLTTVKSYDEYTYFHMANVALLTIAFGQALGLRRDQVRTLGLGALLHDVGKVTVPPEVLNHAGRLSPEQWRLIQEHPVAGAAALFQTGDGLLHPAATVVLEHHAAYDLGGYPELSGRPRPSLPARLVAVADCFDAVTSRRAYRAAADRRSALEILEAGAGSGFDPRAVRTFSSLLGLFPVGSLVEIDDGTVGLVIRNHEEMLGRPTVLTVLDEHGNVAEPEERDLTATDADGQFRWSVSRVLDAERLGIDVMAFLTSGDPSPSLPQGAGGDEDAAGGGEGLVHEPSHGEAPPDGYVDFHRHGDHRDGHSHDHGQPDDPPVDPDVSPPM